MSARFPVSSTLNGNLRAIGSQVVHFHELSTGLTVLPGHSQLGKTGDDASTPSRNFWEIFSSSPGSAALDPSVHKQC